MKTVVEDLRMDTYHSWFTTKGVAELSNRKNTLFALNFEICKRIKYVCKHFADFWILMWSEINFKYKHDIEQVPPDLKEKWTFISIERKCSQSNVVELSKWLDDVAWVHNQLIAKRIHVPRGETEIQKLNHIHQTKTRACVTEDKSQNLKKQSRDQFLRWNKIIHKLWNYQEFKIINVN